VGRVDRYLQPEAADPVLTPTQVRRLATPHLPAGVVDEPCVVDESGGEARAYLLGTNVVVKVQRPHRLRPRTSLAKEAALLAALAAVLRGRIPELFGYDRVLDPALGVVEFIVMGRVPGRAVRHLPVTGPARAALLGDLATVLQTVHALDPPAPTGGDADGGGLPTDATAAAVQQRFELGFADLVDELGAQPQRWTLPVSPAQVAGRATAALPTQLVGRPVPLHSNPGPTHTFVDVRSRFTGLIDFGDAYCSHPALDLRTWPDPAERIALRWAYLDGADPGGEFDAVWTVGMIYADMRAMLGGGAVGERAAADLAHRLTLL